MVGVARSLSLRIFFVYIILDIVPITFLIVSIMYDFTATKVAVLAILLLLLFYSGSRRKLR